MEYGLDDDEEPTIRVDSNHSGLGSTLYYPLQEHPSAPYNAPGNRECSFKFCHFGLLHAIALDEQNPGEKIPKRILIELTSHSNGETENEN